LSEEAEVTGAGHNARLVWAESLPDARRLLEELGSDKGGVAIMSRKMKYAVVSVENVQARAANLIKQVMLSKGGECATPRDVLLKSSEPVRVLMMGTVTQFRQAVKNLSVQPFGLAGLSDELKALLRDVFPDSDAAREIVAGEYRLPLGGRTLVMGVLNVTPDSFSDGGRYENFEAACVRAIAVAAEGADIVDIGGESTRPGAEAVSLEEELGRTVPVIESVAGEIAVPISIDTCKAEVARRALDAGASIVNDISGLGFDPDMIPLVAERGVPVVIMHMQGTPRDMQKNPVYDDVVGDITRFLRTRAGLAIEAGVEREKIIVDPGIGFGKTLEHNLEIVRRLDEFRSLGYPVLLGTSRKRFIGAVLDRPADERLLGSAATVAFSVARGVDIVRVHDVKEMLEVVKMADAIAGKARPG
jgi:dihydropteroate synthase